MHTLAGREIAASLKPHYVYHSFRRLIKYEEKLMKRRQAAEEMLSYKQELERKERELREEEGNINKLIEKAMIDEEDKVTITETKPSGATGGGTLSYITEDVSSYTNTFEISRSESDDPLTSTPHQPLGYCK